jgi:hypothetical protein
MNFFIPHGTLVEIEQMRGEKEIGRGCLLHLPFREPFLTAPLGFTLLGFFPDTRLLIKPAAFQFPKQAFPGKLLFGDLERLFNIIIEDFDFHISYVIPSNTMRTG